MARGRGAHRVVTRTLRLYMYNSVREAGAKFDAACPLDNRRRHRKTRPRAIARGMEARRLRGAPHHGPSRRQFVNSFDCRGVDRQITIIPEHAGGFDLFHPDFRSGAAVIRVDPVRSRFTVRAFTILGPLQL